MRFVASSSLSLLLLVACSHAQPAPVPVPSPAPVVAESAPAPEPAPPPEPVAVTAPPEIETVSLFFSYDDSDLSPATRTALQDFFQRLQTQPDQDVRIEGNCDERGTTEYNLALGQRRADAAKKYLQNLGMDPARITAVSNGKERPVAGGHEEAAWQQNRRDDLIPVTTKVAASGAEAMATR